jgi:lipopolysaccharide transport system ATP-binding protein
VTIVRAEHVLSDTKSGFSGEWDTFRERIVEIGLRPIRRVPQPSGEDFIWALRDVSFEVKQGEVLAVIGRNGAGKSTLLKILSRITRPTEGFTEMRGRIGSLLEVGTGFHPELTGRENIYLNGAILNMSRREIRLKFDEIVAFAGVEKFIDTPAKHYSSGMYLRLAFAVAAHMEPEILIVDEVLAVGDMEFQKKSLGQMEKVAKEGRTVIFVSHNMAAVSQLCQTAIILAAGRASEKLDVQEAVLRYTQQSKTAAEGPIKKLDVTIHEFAVQQEGVTLDEYDGAKPIDVYIRFELDRNITDFRIGFFLTSSLGGTLTRCLLADWDKDHIKMQRGMYEMRGSIPAKLLNWAGTISNRMSASLT